MMAQTLDSPSSSVSTAASLGGVHGGSRPTPRKSAPSALARCATAFGVVDSQNHRPNEPNDGTAPAEAATTVSTSATGAANALRADAHSDTAAECSVEPVVAAPSSGDAADTPEADVARNVDKEGKAEGSPELAISPKDIPKSFPQPAPTPEAKSEACGPVVFNMAADDSDDECAWSAPRSPQPASPGEPNSPWEADLTACCDLVHDSPRAADVACQTTGWEVESFIGEDISCEDHVAAADVEDFLGGPATNGLSGASLAYPSQGSAASRGSWSPRMPTIRTFPVARRGSVPSTLWMRPSLIQPELAMGSDESGGRPSEPMLGCLLDTADDVSMPPLRSATSASKLRPSFDQAQHRRRASALLAAPPPPPITGMNPASRRKSAPALLGLLSPEPGEEVGADPGVVRKYAHKQFHNLVSTPPISPMPGKSPQSPPESSTSDRGSAYSSGTSPCSPNTKPPWARRSSTPTSASSPIAGVGAVVILR